MAPLVIISDINNNERFRYEAQQIKQPNTEPIQNFKLTELTIHAGINTDHGYCTIGIDDRDNLMLDTSDRRRPIKIKNGWKLEVYLGKSFQTLSKWFTGIIQEPELTRPGANLQNIGITAFGWGIRTAHRVGIIQRFQKKLADGVNVDATDNNAKISEIFKDILEDDDVAAHPGLSPESGITTDAITSIDLKLSDYQRKFQTLATMLSEVAQMGAAVYGIDPNLDAFLRIRGAEFSGFLLTNDTKNPGVITRNWNSDKIMFIRNQSLNYKESTIDGGYSIFHGLGAQHDTLDYESTSANALISLSSKHHAFPFDPQKDNLSKLTPFLSKIGTTENRKSLIIKIVGANQDNSTPNPEDIRQTLTIPGHRLENELSLAAYFEVQFNKDIISVSHGEKLFMLIQKYDDTANPIRIDYQTAQGTFYDSDDGINWISRIGQAKFRTFHSRTIHIIGQNCTTRKRLRIKETMFSLQDFPNENTALQAFEGMMESLGKIKRIYDPIIVTAPTARPEIGKTVKLVDKFNGLDVEADLIGYDISISAFDATSNRGATFMTLYLEDWYL